MELSSSADFVLQGTSPPMCLDTTPADHQLDVVVTNLFNEYAQSICAYIHVLVKDWQLAQELTQDAYLRLYRSRNRLPEVQNQRAWVYRIAHNVALTELKRRKRFAWLPWNGTDDEPDFAWVESTQQIDDRADIEETLRLLPEPYRAPLILYSGHGLSVKEVAEALGLTEGAVKMRLYRAREMFRQHYLQENESLEDAK